MKLSKELNDILVEQVRRELESAQVYNGMRIYFKDANYPGAEQWMTVQIFEEVLHAEDFINFIQEIGGELPSIGAIAETKCEYDSMLDVFEHGLEHEFYISDSIKACLEQAIEDKNYAAENFLRGYIDEQLEEEDHFRTQVETLREIGDNKSALYKYDEYLGTRSGNLTSPNGAVFAFYTGPQGGEE